MGGACCKYGKGRSKYRILVENLKGRDNLGDLGIFEKTKLLQSLKK
jgi:hypothetical protein